jgi:hypothetical protein
MFMSKSERWARYFRRPSPDTLVNYTKVGVLGAAVLIVGLLTGCMAAVMRQWANQMDITVSASVRLGNLFETLSSERDSWTLSLSLLAINASRATTAVHQLDQQQTMCLKNVSVPCIEGLPSVATSEAMVQLALHEALADTSAVDLIAIYDPRLLDEMYMRVATIRYCNRLALLNATDSNATAFPMLVPQPLADIDGISIPLNQQASVRMFSEQRPTFFQTPAAYSRYFSADSAIGKQIASFSSMNDVCDSIDPTANGGTLGDNLGINLNIPPTSTPPGTACNPGNDSATSTSRTRTRTLTRYNAAAQSYQQSLSRMIDTLQAIGGYRDPIDLSAGVGSLGERSATTAILQLAVAFLPTSWTQHVTMGSLFFYNRTL